MTCIYIIQNKINNKFYLGSTVDFIKRRRTHLRELKNNKHHCIALQRAVNKYGLINFEFKVLKLCNSGEQLVIESIFLKSLRPDYNTSIDATAPMAGRKHSKATLNKLKNRPQAKGKDSPSYGTKWTSEMREKILAKMIGSKRSAETRLKMSNTAKRINSIGRVNRDNIRKKVISSDGNVFNSLVECAIFYNMSVSSVCDVLKGRTKYLNRKYKLDYKKE
jgi:group I intron endonuclease